MSKKDMNRETKYQKTGSVKLTIGIVLIYIAVQAILFVCNLNNSIALTFLAVSNVFFVIYCVYVLKGKKNSK